MADLLIISASRSQADKCHADYKSTKSSGQQLTKYLWACWGLAGLFPLKTFTSGLEPSAIPQNALSKQFFFPMYPCCNFVSEVKSSNIGLFYHFWFQWCSSVLHSLCKGPYSFYPMIQGGSVACDNDDNYPSENHVVMFYRRVFGHPVPQDIQDSVGGCSSDHKLFVTVSLICRETCRKHTHVYRLHLSWPVTLIETFLAFLFRKTEAKRQNKTALDRNRGVGRSAGTSAGEGHPSIFFLGRCALVGSSCSDRKRGGSRQGAAVVIEFSTWGHHHAVVVGKQWELYREGERLRGKQNDHKTCLTNMDKS